MLMCWCFNWFGHILSNIHTQPRSPAVPTVPPRRLPHHWTPACVIWAWCRPASQPGSVTNITRGRSLTAMCITSRRIRRGGCRVLEEDDTRRPRVRDRNISLGRVRQGTSGTKESFSCCHYGSISEADPSNVMLESQLQISAEHFHEAYMIVSFPACFSEPSHQNTHNFFWFLEKLLAHTLWVRGYTECLQIELQSVRKNKIKMNHDHITKTSHQLKFKDIYLQFKEFRPFLHIFLFPPPQTW